MSRKLFIILLTLVVLLSAPMWFLAKGKVTSNKFKELDKPLLRAASALDPKAVKDLLAKGADPNCADEYGMTPLMHASQGLGMLGDLFWDRRKESAEVARLLCDAGAQPNLQTSQGVTALMLMALTRNELGIKVLLASKANPHIQDRRGRTALTYSARANGDGTRLLLEAGSKPSLIDLMLFGKKQDVLERLKTMKAIHGVGVGNESALFLAAENDWTDVAKLLIERGANVNAANRDGETPLMVAIGGYFSLWQSDGQRHWSKHGDRPEPDPQLPERIEVVKLLIRHGANVNAKMKEWDFKQPKIYALTIARETLSDTIQEILEQAGATEYDKKSPSMGKKTK